MSLAELIQNLFFDYTLRTVALGSALLGTISGTLGSYAVLRRQSLLGDAISHAALPGIVIAFIITQSKAPLVLAVGAAIAGWIGTLFIISIVKTSRIKYDTALGIILSVFFGFGLVLLTFIQRSPDAAKAGLDNFLFGQASALLSRDVLTIALLGIVIAVMILAFWKEFKLLCFDREFGASLGFNMNRLDVLMTALLVVAIVVGLQTVGVVLMSAMVVAPAAAARQWTDRLSIMLPLAALLGASAGIGGTAVSSTVSRMPTGPVIVLCISAIVFVSFLLAPNRGLVWRTLREKNNRRQLRLKAVLNDLYALAKQHDDPEHAHPTSVLHAMSVGHGGVLGSLTELQKRDWVQQIEPGRWSLTPVGLAEAEKLIQKDN